MVVTGRFDARMGVLALAFVAAAMSPAQGPNGVDAHRRPASSVVPTGRLPATFIENRGQFDARARFVVRQGPVTTFVGAERFVVSICAPPADVAETARGVNLFFTFEGAAEGARVDGASGLPGRMNYFIGNDPAKWVTDAPTWSSVRATGIYDDVAVEFHDAHGQVEYDVLVGPTGDPSRVVVRCDGANGLSLDESGALLANTSMGVVRQECPRTWRIREDGGREIVDCRFRILDATRFGFDVPSHRPGQRLVIDPVIVVSGILAGSSYDLARAVAVDSSGAMFVTGRTTSADYPRSPGAFDSVLNNTEAFVTKLTPAGNAIVFSTYLGSAGADQSAGMALDSQGRAVITGKCGSGFPTTTGAYDTAYNGWSDVFVTKLNATGTGLVFSTYLGGGNDDYPGGVTLNAADEVLVCGSTKSTNFPTSAGAWDGAPNGDFDAFVGKLSASGSTLVASTLIGGSSIDSATGVRACTNGQIVIAGASSSPNFPSTAGSFDSTPNGLSDAIVCRFTANLGQLVWSTFLGGSGDDQALALDMDASDAPVITGQAYPGYPVTSDAVRPSSQNSSDAFVTKVAANGATLVYSTYLGGGASDAGYDLALDGNGAPVVVGYTNSPDLLVTPNAVQSTFMAGGLPEDGFVVKLSGDGRGVVFSSFIGGNGSDQLRGVALDPAGAIYLTGTTSSSNLPALSSAFASPQGLDDCFFMKIALGAPAMVNPIGPGCGTSTTPPTLVAGLAVVGAPVLASGSFAPPYAIGELFSSSTIATSTLSNGCPLYLGGVGLRSHGQFSVNANGTWSLPGMVPNAEALVGQAFGVQALFLSPSAPTGFAVSAGVRMAVGY